MIPLLDGPVEGGGAPVSSEKQLQEQEKRIEISCALAAEASRRSRILSGEGRREHVMNIPAHTSMIHPAPG